MRRWKVALALAATAPALAVAAPLGPGDRASAETMFSALQADPFAEDPLRALERIYDRGPGRAVLLGELRRRAASGAVPDLVLLGRFELELGHRAEGTRPLAQAAATTHDGALELRLARLLDDNGDRPGALAAYQAGLAGASAVEERGILLRMGALQLASGKPADARASWDQAKRLAPSDQSLRRQIAEALAARGSFSEAIAELKELEPLVSGEPAALIAVLRRAADFARRAGDRHLGSSLLLRAYLVAARQRTSPLRGELTLELLRMHNADRSAPASARARGLRELEKLARAAEATDPAAAVLVGDVLAARPDAAGATAAYRRAVLKRPEDAYALERLSALETGADRIRDLRALFEVDRTNAAVGLDLAAALFDATRTEEAVSQARAVQERFPDNPVLLGELGALLAKHARHAEALAVYEAELRLDPDRPDSLIAYADELRALGRGAEAEKAYFRLVAHDPSPQGYRQLIQVLDKRKLPADIKRAYQEALDKSPADDTLRRDFARWLGVQGDIDGATALWKQLAERSKDGFLRSYAAHEIQRLEYQKMFHQ